MVKFFGIRFGKKKKRRAVPEPTRPSGGPSRTLLALADSSRYAALPLPPRRPGSPGSSHSAGQGTGGSTSGQVGSSASAGNLHTGSLRSGGDPGSPAGTPGRSSGREIHASGGVLSGANREAGAVVGGGQPSSLGTASRGGEPSSSLGRDAAPPRGYGQPAVLGPERPPLSQPGVGPGTLQYASPLSERPQYGPGTGMNRPPTPAGTWDAIPPAVRPPQDQDTPLGLGPGSPASTSAMPFYSRDGRGYRTGPPAASSAPAASFAPAAPYAPAHQALTPSGHGGGSSLHWGPSITSRQAQVPEGRGQAVEHLVQPPNTDPAHVPAGRDQRLPYQSQSTQTQPTHISDRHGQRVQPPPSFSLFPRPTRVPDGHGQQRPAPPRVSGYTNPAQMIETVGQRAEPPARPTVSSYTNPTRTIGSSGQRVEPPAVSNFTRQTGFTSGRIRSEPVYYYDGRAHRHPPPSFSDRRAQQLPLTNLNDRRGQQPSAGTFHHGGGQRQQPGTSLQQQQPGPSLHNGHGQWPDTPPPPYPADEVGYYPYNRSQEPAPHPANRGQWSEPPRYPTERPGHLSDGHDPRARPPDYYAHGYGQRSQAPTGHIPDGRARRHEPHAGHNVPDPTYVSDGRVQRHEPYNHDRVRGPNPPLPQRSAVRHAQNNEAQNGWSNTWRQTEIRIMSWIADTNEAHLGRRASIEQDFPDSATPAFLENRPAEMPQDRDQMPGPAYGPDPGRVDMRMQSASPRSGPGPGQIQGQRMWPSAPPNDGPRSQIPYPTRVPQRLRQDPGSPRGGQVNGPPPVAPHHLGLPPPPGVFPQGHLRAIPRGYHRPEHPFVPYAGRGQRPELSPNPGSFWPMPDLSSSQLTLREVAPPLQRGYRGPVMPFLPSAGLRQGPELDPTAEQAQPTAGESMPAAATSGDTVPPLTHGHEAPMPLPQGGGPSSELESGQIPEPLRPAPILSLARVSPDGWPRPTWNPPEREDYEYGTTHGGHSLATPETSPSVAPVTAPELPSDQVGETAPRRRDLSVMSAPTNGHEDHQANVNRYTLTSSFYSDDEPMLSRSAPARADDSSWPLAAAGQISAEAPEQTTAGAPEQTSAHAPEQTSSEEPGDQSADGPVQSSYFPQGQSPTRRQGRYDDFDFGPVR